MWSIRWRLTAGYVVALVATILAFGTTLYVDRRQSSLRELDQRLSLEADLSIKYLSNSYRVLGPLVTVDSLPALVTGIASYFENIQDFLVLVDREGRVLFTSDKAAGLSYASGQKLRQEVNAKPLERRTGTFTFDPAVGPARFRVEPVATAGPEVGAMILAASIGDVSFGPGALLGSMLVIAPVIILASGLLGYWVAGASLRPLDDTIDELTAITDGRSLHRRLPMDATTSDELSRLAQAVNNMFARLEQSFSVQQRFVADASHELKTPLMVLRAGVERALTNPGAPPESLQALDESLQEINWMAELVDSLLTLARADEGRAALTGEECDVRELVNEAAETAGMLAEETALTVRTQIPETPVRLRVDRNRIRQLLLNLVTNAVKYTPAGGEVAVQLTDHGGTVDLVVRDTGIGIAAGDLPHIFDRFWRADVSRSREGSRPGSGLGLAITKWIAEAHGGSIAVQSRPGKGTVFTVSLPRSSESEAVR